MRIRIADSGDLDTVAALHSASWQDAYADSLDPDWLRNECAAFMVQKWAPRLAAPDAFVVTLALGDDDPGSAGADPGGNPAGDEFVAGFSCVEFADGPMPRLDNLHVVPRLRRARVGSTLFDGVRDTVRAASHPSFDLLVFTTNQRARSFYERHGGVAHETIDDPMPDGSTARSVRYEFSVS